MIAGLVYWLLVLAGLEGVTVLRADAAPRELAALWTGSLLGVALGQIFAWMRLRAWVFAALAMAGFWLTPVLFIAFWGLFGSEEGTCFLALVPALVGGYLSLSPRGGLVAFWYPTVLWMIVVFDGPAAGRGTEARAALPYVVALGALFVAFLRARETRRVALWQAHADERLAKPRARTVLRASPARAASQLAWTVLVGATSLALAAWIAPHLWHEKLARSPSAAAPVYGAAGGTNTTPLPCCHPKQRRVVMSEYLPLLHGRDESAYEDAPLGCVSCTQPTAPVTASNVTSRGTADDGADSPPPTTPSEALATPAAAGAAAHEPAPIMAAPPTPVAPAVPAHPPAVVTPAAKPPAPQEQRRVAPESAPTAAAAPSFITPASDPVVPSGAVPTVVPAAPPLEASVLWKWLVVACAAAVLGRLGARALRRAFTLRHLKRPFWPTTIDQRVSNHWERALVGLRDAGVRPRPNETPGAFARRIGAPGMETCATTLERVRHGVRVEADDLDAMDAAATSVYRTARRAAGPVGRAVAWLRWPLA